MFSYAPPDYVCPICLAINGVENDKTMILQDDIIYRDNVVMALVNSKFVKGNPGHVIIVPIVHYETLFNIPDDVSAGIISISKKVAIALKKLRKCDGIMIQQNNGPASSQHAFHYHMHVFPRFTNDNFWKNSQNTYIASAEEKRKYADSLRGQL